MILRDQAGDDAKAEQHQADAEAAFADNAKQDAEPE